MLTQLRIRSRIFAGFGALILICCFVVAAGVAELSSIGVQVATLSTTFDRAATSQQLSRLAEVMRRAVVRYKTAGDDDEIAIFVDAAASAMQLLGHGARTTLGAERRESHSDGATLLSTVRRNFEKLVDLQTQSEAERAALFGNGESMTSASDDLTDRARATGDADMVARAVDVAGAIQQVQIANWRFLATMDPKGPPRFQASIEAADDALAAFARTPGADRLAASASQVATTLKTYAASFATVSSIMLQADRLFESDIGAVLARFEEGQERARQSLTRDLAGVEAATLTTTRTGTTAQALLGIVGIAFGLLLASVIGGGIVAPVAAMTAAMRRLADRDVTVDIPGVGRGDEIGAMAKAVEVFRQGMLHEAAMARQQQATQTFLDTVLENVPAPIFVKNARDLTYVHVNLAAEGFLGVGRAQLLGTRLAQMVPASAMEQLTTRDMAALAAREEIVSHDEVVATPTNGERLATVTRVAIAGADGEPEYLLTMIEDVTERRQAETRIAYLALNDTLTDLPNRVSFARHLDEAVRRARQDGERIAVLGLDLDHFKEVNDTLGHAAGDTLLSEVAGRFRDCLRKGDILARIGGDEFAAIQYGVGGLQDAERLAKRLIEAAEAPFDIGGRQVLIGLSVGITLSQPSTEQHELLKQADMALYEAKEGGRGCSRFFVPEMDARLHERRALERDLLGAMAADQLSLNYQPKVDLVTGRVVGAEALMRWRHPERGQVPPSRFIPVLEQIGLIDSVGAWLLRTACAEATTWGGGRHVAVNVSPVQLALPGFVDTVQDALDGSGLDPANLELEVTEGILLRDTDESLKVFAALRALGVRLVLDDYGTGYASLSYLKKFRFDKIKIDQSFIRGICTDRAAAAIVRSTIELSQSLGMQTNAEGVETEAEALLLRGFKCAEGQGYFFWRPLTAPAMRTLVEDAVPHETAP